MMDVQETTSSTSTTHCPRRHKTSRPYLMPDGDLYVVRHGHAYLDADGQVVTEPVRLAFEAAEAAAERHEFRVG